ncbi:hypothetical protein [Actinoplanes sp. NPDC026670]|uniref:hypothetical protein n=1 Tax=Actinoplanes sp. NPDC026670 TaxID=3154700 RepID=UPI00340EB0AB
MSEEVNHQPEQVQRPLSRSRWGRGRIAAGTAGLAALLGVGAYVITGQIVADDEQTQVAQEIRRIGPAGTGSATPSASSAPQASESATGTSASPTASPTPVPSEVVEEIKEARRKMAAEGVPVKPPVKPKVAQATADVDISDKGTLKEGGIVRIMSSRSDLTGQRELAYVAGGIFKYRKASCSQTFQFSTNPSPAKRDNLLMCWRTSDDKSVVAMVVDPKGHPSREKALDALEKKWRDM